MQGPAAIFSQINGAGGNPQFPEQEHLKCPRCDSSNTKFCYYNNYNLSQPRHFCKNCRRYWTKGGVLRNIPVGGGSRKNSKRNSSTSKNSTTPPPAASSSSSPLPPPPPDAQPPPPPKSEPYRLMLINAAVQPASLDHYRPISDHLSGGNFTSLLAANRGHFGNSIDGLNLIDHGQTQSSLQAQGPSEGYRPSFWSGGNDLAMYTPEYTNFQHFIEFPSTRTKDS